MARNNCKPVTAYKDGAKIETYRSVGEAAKKLGLSSRENVRKVVTGQKPSYFGYTFKYATIEVAPLNADIDGLANLFWALNEPCYCEQFENIRSHIAPLILGRYRHARTLGFARLTAKAFAREVEGYDCGLNRLDRWWKRFFDYHESSRLMHKHVTVRHWPWGKWEQ